MFNIKSGDITLREFVVTDIDNKIEWINDERNNQYLHYDIPLNKEKTTLWFNNKQKNRLDCIIEYKNIPVGLIGLINLDEKNRKAEFYISMGRHDYKRKGIASGASKMILQYAFQQLNYNKVYLNVDEENIVACKLYEKLGFEIEGRFINDIIHHGVFVNRIRYAIFNKSINK